MKPVSLSTLRPESFFRCYSAFPYFTTVYCVEYFWFDGDVLCSYYDSVEGRICYVTFDSSMLVLVAD